MLSTESSSCPASTGWLCLPALLCEGGISEVSYILVYPMEAGLSFTNELFHLRFYLRGIAVETHGTTGVVLSVAVLPGYISTG